MATADAQVNMKAIASHVAAQLGYPSLKDKQADILVEFMHGNDVFGVLPTGYGKSLCYACLPRMFDELHKENNSIVIVVSPLTAIMIDQVCIHNLYHQPPSCSFVILGGYTN